MIKVNTDDGRTATIDLSDEAEARRWFELLKDPAYQAAIRGIVVHQHGQAYSIGRPAGFTRVVFLAEAVQPEPERKNKGGERVTCYADGVRVTLMVHRESKAARVGLARTGELRFSPLLS